MSEITLNSTTESPLSSQIDAEIAHIGKNWPWLLVMGFIYLILGAIAFTMPVATTAGLTLAIGLLLIILGVAQLVQAVRLRHRHGGFTRVLQCVLSLLAGGMILRYPEGGMLSISLVLGFYFLISATAQAALAWSLRQHKIYWWGIVGATASFLLGLYILFTFPFSALWIPGLVLSIDMIASGAALIGFAFTAREVYHRSSGYKNEGPRGRGLQPSGQMG
jgi:uncharacterized membrane protein HdeD (DUF308 family)